MVNKITTPPTTSELIDKVNEIVDDKQDVISDLATIRSGAALGATAIQPNDNISELNNNVGYITGITSGDVTTALGYIPYNSSNPSNYQTATQVANSIATETTNRENADNNLQSQIDAIVSSSDVFDIVGTYAELQAYDITTVPVNDIIKVLVDSTHSGAATYYRCVETGGVKSWSYIGSEGAYYTKGEADAAFVPQTRTVNNKALSANISLTAADVGADVSGAASTAETNAKNYADGLASNYATAAQGALADTALQPNDNISELVNDAGYITGISSSDVTIALGYTPYDSSNPSGYTSNVGTVTSVNNVSPVSGNVTLSIPTVNDATITITQGGVTKGSFTLNQASGDTIALDAGGGSSYTAGTGIDITSDVISVTNPTLTNTGYNGTEMSSSSVNVKGLTGETVTAAVSVGINSRCTNNGGTAIGNDAQSLASGATALGVSAHASASYAIQLGIGTNSEANSLYVGTASSYNWKLLDSNGLIPNARINMDNSPTSSSTNTVTSGGVYTALSGKTKVTFRDWSV